MLSSATSTKVGLEGLISRLIPGSAVSGLRRLTGGASQQMWSFDALTDHAVQPLILRVASQRERSPGTLDLSSEASLIQFAEKAGVPVPKVRYVLHPEDGLGEGFIMDRIEGETLPGRILKSDDFAAIRPKLADQCGQILQRIHAVPVESLSFLDTTTPRIEIDRQYAIYEGNGLRRPVFELAFSWLRENMPAAIRTPCLVHGDFRNGNLMVDAEGIRAVLDWELAHLGDPMKDLGWICVNSWRFGQREHPVGGFGSREALFAGYEREGEAVDRNAVDFWEMFGTLKWGLICQRMARTFQSGVERTVERAVIGRRASETEIDLLHLLSPHA